MSDTEPTESGDASMIEPDHEELRVFWELARFHAKLNAAPSYFGPPALESVPPPAWSHEEDADEFVEGVLADEQGVLRAAVADYDGELPERGVLSILCDGSGKPRALLEVTGVDVEAGEVVESFRVVYSA